MKTHLFVISARQLDRNDNLKEFSFRLISLMSNLD